MILVNSLLISTTLKTKAKKVFALIMIQGAIISTASMATVNVMEGKALFKGFHERNLALSMASGGMTAGLNASEFISEFSTTLKMGEHAREAFTSTFVNTSANTAIGGQNLGDAFLQSGVSAAGSYGMAKLSNAIGIQYKKEEFGYVIHKGLHGLSGAAVGAATYAALDRDIAKGAASGAVGAITAEVIGEAFMTAKLNAHDAPRLSEAQFDKISNQAVLLGQIGAALGADALGLDAGFASTIGGVSVRENAVFVPIIIAGLAAYEAYEIYEVYKTEGPLAALKKAGVDMVVGAATGAVVGKSITILSKVGGKLVTKVYGSPELAWQAMVSDNRVLSSVINTVDRVGNAAFVKITKADAAATRAVVDPVIKKLGVPAGTKVTAYDLRRYLFEVKDVSNLPLHKDQIRHLKNVVKDGGVAKLDPTAKLAHSNQFTRSQKDKLIAEWEVGTKQSWPTYPAVKNGAPVLDPVTGQQVYARYEFHHIIPQQYSGPHAWWNGHPVHKSVHQGGVHGKDSVLRDLMKKAGE